MVMQCVGILRFFDRNLKGQGGARERECKS